MSDFSADRSQTSLLHFDNQSSSGSEDRNSLIYICPYLTQDCYYHTYDLAAFLVHTHTHMQA